MGYRLVAALTLLGVICISGTAESSEKLLAKNLFEAYTREGRPVKDASKNVTLKVTLSLLQLINLDTKQGVLSGKYWITLEWSDEYLVWNPDDFGGVTQISLPTSKIWIPDFELYNRGSSMRQRWDTASPVVVYSSGMISMVAEAWLDSTCDITPGEEIQTCELKFGSWTHNGYMIDLQLPRDDIDISVYRPTSAFKLKGTSAMRHEAHYDCCPEPYIDVRFTVRLHEEEESWWR